MNLLAESAALCLLERLRHPLENTDLRLVDAVGPHHALTMAEDLGDMLSH